MRVSQLVVYQPAGDGAQWQLVSAWDARAASAPEGMAFKGNNTERDGFRGTVGTECLVNVSTRGVFACGAGSDPFCPMSNDTKYSGWSGSKLFVMLASMEHADTVGSPCSSNTMGNWYDAPWVGLSVGELVRAGAFSNCQCYAKAPARWYLGDGCGQFNVFEVVNDNNAFRNLEVFSTSLFGYGGYVGEGPCGARCTSPLAPEVDFVNTSNGTAATMGAVSNPMRGPGAAFRRPVHGPRYFLVLLDVTTRTIQLAMIHPSRIPSAASALLPALPTAISRANIDALLALRLPQ
jgi:hypothetical protein